MSIFGPHWVYIQYGEDNQVLYVGATGHLRGRAESHRRETAWAAEITRTETFGPYTRANALLTERIMIGVLEPLYNLNHNPRNRGIRTGLPNGASNTERSAAIRAAVRSHRGLTA